MLLSGYTTHRPARVLTAARSRVLHLHPTEAPAGPVAAVDALMMPSRPIASGVAKDRLAVLNVHVVAVEQPGPLEVPSGEANTAAVIATISADQSRHHQVHAQTFRGCGSSRVSSSPAASSGGT